MSSQTTAASDLSLTPWVIVSPSTPDNKSFSQELFESPPGAGLSRRPLCSLDVATLDNSMLSRVNDSNESLYSGGSSHDSKSTLLEKDTAKSDGADLKALVLPFERLYASDAEPHQSTVCTLFENFQKRLKSTFRKSEDVTRIHSIQEEFHSIEKSLGAKGLSAGPVFDRLHYLLNEFKHDLHYKKTSELDNDDVVLLPMAKPHNVPKHLHNDAPSKALDGIAYGGLFDRQRYYQTKAEKTFSEYVYTAGHHTPADGLRLMASRCS